MIADPSLIGLPAGISAQEAAAQFDLLQKKLVPLWRSIECFNQDEQTIVVVPSISLEMAVSGFEVQGYEERFLFLLFLLAQPRARLTYVTSQAIHPSVIEYYLGLLPGVIRSHAMRRLTLFSPYDDSARPLSMKLLERPRLLERIAAEIADKDRAHLVCYNTTWLERNLALRLGIPLYGADPRHFSFGTKTGCRQLFAQAGINHPLGFDNLHSLEEATAALARMKTERPTMRQAIVKLNEGVSGEGNALVDLSDLPAGAPEKAIAERVRAMNFEKANTRFEDYAEKFRERGGVVEERVGVGAAEVRSPSVQLRVTPLGDVELLSTHDQMLGGPSGQAYLGCKFPASPEYAREIMSEALKVGRRLAKEGVLGRFALDFVTVLNDENQWEVYAIEINLRKGGTTHPFLTLQFLTDGAYDAEAGVFRTPRGEEKSFVASDHVHSPAYRAFTHRDLFDIGARHGLNFDQSRQRGVVFHMINGIGEQGALGLTAVGNTRAEAEALYEKTVAVLDEEAKTALSRPGTPA